ncbi:discoidin domain-containing protein [Actinoplanes sp. LDG1-06]|uniref:Discoidin domain-containing protein n=1 Tax=Paractinoplanes ovalisporus TaxID=2810368 RepID=A0ABS2ACJ3_9ACTN|nr:glycoside hydrolase family 30 beta sandwich domain-containing protein [Actinoplanes ovalisporus]MBM2617078.1 discoidin domain-containing protein [Actinoplanes ovalisporus]
MARFGTTLVAIGATVLAAAPLPASAHSSKLTAQVWITTPDGTQRLADQGRVAFDQKRSDAGTVVVDPNRRFQTIAGFGASITDSSASVLYRLTPRARDAAMQSLFRDNRLSYLRQPIGASDFTDGPAYTYDDVPAGQTDYGLKHFSIDHDRAQILPLLRQARRLNPDLRVMGTPWSPPAWMKTNGSLVGGRLIDSPAIYRAYAAYLVTFVRAYRKEGVPIDTLTLQNEPQNRTPAGYPGMDLPSWQAAEVIERLGPMLRAAGERTKILGYDHNWSEHPNDAANTPPDSVEDIDHYPQALLAKPAARWVEGTAYHCYYGDPSAMTALHNEFPAKDIYFTECSGSQSSDPANTFSDTLKWHARNLIIGNTRNWAKTVINWNLALDENNGPHNGGCGTCTGVLTVASDGTVTRNAEFYTLGHVARFVKPGAVRVASTSFGTTGWNGQVMTVAFVNPDGSTALVAHNENDEPRKFAVQYGGRTLEYTLPGGALATFVWRGHSDDRPIAPTGWTATANPAADAALAVDDDASTRWTTGVGQQAGQYLQVDMRAVHPVRKIVFDTGADLGDYPRGVTVTASTDGSRWRTVKAAGTGQFVEAAPGRARYVRITLTGAAPDNWWSVADVRAYR